MFYDKDYNLIEPCLSCENLYEDEVEYEDIDGCLDFYWEYCCDICIEGKCPYDNK